MGQLLLEINQHDDSSCTIPEVRTLSAPNSASTPGLGIPGAFDANLISAPRLNGSEADL